MAHFVKSCARSGGLAVYMPYCCSRHSKHNDDNWCEIAKEWLIAVCSPITVTDEGDLLEMVVAASSTRFECFRCKFELLDSDGLDARLNLRHQAEHDAIARIATTKSSAKTRVVAGAGCDDEHTSQYDFCCIPRNKASFRNFNPEGR